MKPNQNEILYGHGNLTGIVSVEAQSSGEVSIWRRVDGKIQKSTDRFQPFCLTKDENIANHLIQNGIRVETLDGDLPFRFKILINNKKKINRLFDDFYETVNFDIWKDSRFDCPNLASQYLISSGNTYYKGLEFDDVVRMAMDIETTGLNPEYDQVFLIAISTNRGKKIILEEQNEFLLLKKLAHTIQEIDPDIIENHNVFGFDLRFLEKRFLYHRISFNFGRKNCLPHESYSYADVFSANDSKDKYFTRFHVAGREVVDTMQLCQRYNSITRVVKNSKLKDMAKHFNLNVRNEEPIPGDQIYLEYQKDPEKVKRYALADVNEVQGITNILLRDRFELVKLVPIRFEKICTCGNTNIIEYPLIRYYLRNNHSIPEKSEEREYSGAKPRALHVGYFENICKIDVASMYPSIIIEKKFGPNYKQSVEKDPLDIFIKRLEALKEMRLDFKKMAKNGVDSTSKSTEKALKIIINASYGYLGSPNGKFNNYDSAEAVTTYAREVVDGIEQQIANKKCIPLETDTDGVICKLSDDLTPSGLEYEINKFLKKTHPGIFVEAESKIAWKSIYVYRTKNYAYINEKDEIKIVGSAFHNKSQPIYFERFTAEMLNLILRGDVYKFKNTFLKKISEVENRNLSILDFAKKDSKIGLSYKSLDGKKNIEKYLKDFDIEYYREMLIKKAWMFRQCFNEIDYANFILNQADVNLFVEGKPFEPEVDFKTAEEVKIMILGKELSEELEVIKRLNLELNKSVQNECWLKLTSFKYKKLDAKTSGFNLEISYLDEFNQYEEEKIVRFLEIDLKKWKTPSMRSFKKQENFEYFMELLLKDLKLIKALSYIMTDKLTIADLWDFC
jgi:DNA polymerase I